MLRDKACILLLLLTPIVYFGASNYGQHVFINSYWFSLFFVWSKSWNVGLNLDIDSQTTAHQIIFKMTLPPLVICKFISKINHAKLSKLSSWNKKYMYQVYRQFPNSEFFNLFWTLFELFLKTPPVSPNVTLVLFITHLLCIVTNFFVIFVTYFVMNVTTFVMAWNLATNRYRVSLLPLYYLLLF